VAVGPRGEGRGRAGGGGAEGVGDGNRQSAEGSLVKEVLLTRMPRVGIGAFGQGISFYHYLFYLFCAYPSLGLVFLGKVFIIIIIICFIFIL
jgi:hypothetical protein